MEEDEKTDYKLHLHKQLDNLVEMGISVYDLEVVNKQAIRSNYILKGKIKEKIELLKDILKVKEKDENIYKQIPIEYLKGAIEQLEELLEGK